MRSLREIDFFLKRIIIIKKKNLLIINKEFLDNKKRVR